MKKWLLRQRWIPQKVRDALAWKGKVLGILDDMKALYEYSQTARKDGKLSEEEAQEIAKKAIAIGYRVKSLL